MLEGRTKTLAVMGVVLGILLAVFSRSSTPSTSNIPNKGGGGGGGGIPYPTHHPQKPTVRPVADYESAQRRLSELEQKLTAVSTLLADRHHPLPTAEITETTDSPVLSRWQQIKAAGAALESASGKLEALREVAEGHQRTINEATHKHQLLLAKLNQDAEVMKKDVGTVVSEAKSRDELLQTQQSLTRDILTLSQSHGRSRDLEVKLQTSQAIIKDTEKKVEAKEATIGGLQTKMEECDRAYKRHSAVVPEGAEEEIERKHTQLHQELGNVRDQLQHVKAKVIDDNKKLKAYQDSISYLGKLSAIEGRVPTVGDVMEHKQKEVQDLKKELEDLHKRSIPELDDEESRATFKQAQARLERELESKLKAINSALEGLRGEGSQGEASAAALLRKKEQAALETVRITEQRVKALEEREAALLRQISEVQARQQELADIIGNREKAQGRYKQCTTPLVEQIEVAKTAADAGRALIAKKQAEAEAVRAEINAQTAEERNRTTRLKKLESDLETITKMLKAQEDSVVRAVNDRTNRVFHLDVTKAEIDQCESGAAAAREKLNTINGQIQALNADMARLSEQVKILVQTM